tara:strand:- start:766 stop:1218 length:453 start_codon:yes stop_codon:yes gene_type:complete
MDSYTLTNAGVLVYSTITGRYLFLLRSGGSYNNHWGLVGGKMESDESLHQGLCREIREEIGISQIGKLIPLDQYTSDNNKFIYHTFLCSVVDEFIPKLNDEHKGYCWVKLEDCPKPVHPGVWKTLAFDSVKSKIKTFEFINPLQEKTHVY